MIALTMEAVQTSETLVNSHQSTRRYNPEDSHLQEDIFGIVEKMFNRVEESAVFLPYGCFFTIRETTGNCNPKDQNCHFQGRETIKFQGVQ
jgi:hypothetical protein